MLKIYSTINTKREGAFLVARSEEEARSLALRFKIVRAEANVNLHEHNMDNHSNIRELLAGNIVGWICTDSKGRWGFKPRAHQIIGTLGSHEYANVLREVKPLKIKANQA